MHVRRGERVGPTINFDFPSRRETIRFHLAIYIRATVTYARADRAGKSRACVLEITRGSWPRRPMGCLSHLSRSPSATVRCLYRALNFLISRVFIYSRGNFKLLLPVVSLPHPRVSLYTCGTFFSVYAFTRRLSDSYACVYF